MATLKLPYVHAYTDSRGKPRVYYRRWGRKIPLCGDPGSVEFARAYEAAKNEPKPEPGASLVSAGSFNELAVRYYRSPQYLALAPRSRQQIRLIIDHVREKDGGKPVARFERRHVHERVAEKIEAGFPTAANRTLKVLRMLMRFAIAEGMRRDDPTAGIKRVRIKSNGYHTWTDAEIAQFEARWPSGSRERLALHIMLFAALRRSDAIALRWSDIVSGSIIVTHAKTGARLALPIHPRLAAELALAKRNSETILRTQYGQPFTPTGFYNWFVEAARKAGLAAGCSPHGLRKAACTRLAEAGASASEIMSVSGHKTLAEAERYVRAAGQRKLAERAFRALAAAEVG